MKNRKNILKNPSFQTIMSSIVCVLIGLIVGYLVLLMINAQGAGDAIETILLNFLNRPSTAAKLRALGNTLAKTAPLLMCALSVCFCYKVGLFNIGAAGQYEIGAGIALYSAIAWHLPWYVCMILAALGGALVGAISGALKAYRNVNEVISGIMLNWIILYFVNMILGGANIKEAASPYTMDLELVAESSMIPNMGLNAFFSNNKTVTIAIVMSVIFAILIWVILNKTKFGYELKATGLNKDGARYAGMKEKRNIIVTLAIGGALAAIGACFLFLTGYQRWSTTQTSVPSMGFNGIAATFLGGLNPIGTIFSSFFIQHITDGGAMIDKAVYPSQISDLISSIIIYLCGFVLFFKTMVNLHLDKKKASTHAKESEGNE